MNRRPARRGAGSGRSVVVSIIVLALAWFAGSADADSGERAKAGEFEIKAAYLYNFSRFVDWPDAAFADPDSPFRICVLGENPFGDALQVLAERRYKERSIVAISPTELTQARDCHILYVADDAADTLDELTTVLDQSHTLTVSSIAGFANRGGAIEFALDGRQVRMIINLPNARRSQLHISSKLLEIAQMVISDRVAEQRG